MAEPIYKLWMFKLTEAWYQLSEEEQATHMAEVNESREKVGGKTIVMCNAIWASEPWMLFGVEEFPGIEAVQKHAADLFEADHFRYFEGVSLLGVAWEPS